MKSFVLVSTYPPRRCGIATFSRDLLEATKKISLSRFDFKVAAIENSLSPVKRYPKEVSWVVSQEDKRGYIKLAESVNELADVIAVIIQHEYGIFGGEFGSYLLEFTGRINKPIITAFHTVLPSPDKKMKRITQKIIDDSSKVIVMSEDSRRLLLDNFIISSKSKVCVIPHGIHPVIFQDNLPIKARLGLPADKMIILSFGFLNPNKGIEYVIGALPTVIKKMPNILYLIMGITHPLVKQKEGEAYRTFLKRKVKKLKLENQVVFINRYLSLRELLLYIQASDLCLVTSLDLDQSVSGTFSYALGSGRSVIATEFRQARFMIDKKVGRLVPPRNSKAIAIALLDLLCHPQKLRSMNWQAYCKTRNMLWTNVAHEYLKIVFEDQEPNANYLLPEINLRHLERMSDEYGLTQFATSAKPNPASGYTIDDNARALICYLKLYKNGYLARKEAISKVSLFLNTIKRSQQPTLRFINYLAGSNPSVTGQNEAEDLEDTQGRVLFALCELKNSTLYAEPEIKKTAKDLFTSIFNFINTFTHLRAISFGLYGLSLLENYLEYINHIKMFALKLEQSYKKHSRSDWHWFEEKLTYANGILCAALLRAGFLLNNREYFRISNESLSFLCDQTFFGDVFVPIGQENWYQRGSKRSLFDQQPEEVYHMVLALFEAWKITKNKDYKKKIYNCFSWFLGNNILGKPLYNPMTGGCFDGLTRQGVNLNQGAESLLSYLLARLTLEEL